MCDRSSEHDFVAKLVNQRERRLEYKRNNTKADKLFHTPLEYKAWSDYILPLQHRACSYSFVTESKPLILRVVPQVSKGFSHSQAWFVAYSILRALRNTEDSMLTMDWWHRHPRDYGPLFVAIRHIGLYELAIG